MAKIIDPDLLTPVATQADLGTNGNVYIDYTNRLIYMAEQGNLTSDGVTLQALYSFLKEEWKNNNTLIKFPFPMVAITPEQFEFVDNWTLGDATTINLLRDGGYAVKRSDGTSAVEYAGIITLGSIGAADQVYYQEFDGTTAPRDVVLTGPVNQVVRVYSNVSGAAVATGVAPATGEVSFDNATAGSQLYAMVDKTLLVGSAAPWSVGDKVDIKVNGVTAHTAYVGSVNDPGSTFYEVYFVDASGAVDATATSTLGVTAGDAVVLESDSRSYFKIFVREYQKLYAQSQLADIGVSQMTYQAYRLPLANSLDLKVTHDDATVSSSLPYTDMGIYYLDGVGFTTFADATTYPANSVVQDSTGRWFITATGGTSNTAGATDVASDTGITDWAPYQGERQIGSAWYAFNVLIDADVANDGNLPTVEEIYEFVQYKLRQNTNINDAGTKVVIGKTADALLRFVGDTLVTSDGVFIDNFSDTDINRIEFYDVGGAKRVFPFVAAGVINFNDNLVSDSGAVYTMFFTDVNGNNFGDADAIIVNDKDGNPITGAVTGPQRQFTFDYDGNTQGGRTPSTDAPVTIVAIGLDKAQYVKTSGTITRSNANSFSLVAALERNYRNPV